MLDIDVFRFGSLDTNGVLLSHGSDAVIFDPDGRASDWLNILDSRGLLLRGIYATHGHFDHIWAIQELIDNTGAPWFINHTDINAVVWSNAIITANHGLALDLVKNPPQKLSAGDTEILGARVKIYETPGHTAGGMVFYFVDEKILIAGDTLFANTCGRTDLPGGSDVQMRASLRKLRDENFDDDVVVISGHGKNSTIGQQRTNNPVFYNN
ncbi:MAG: MBL fold metallo-hydrolase [Rickettsiales bacterium]|jgi:glyoxylase-like metal-dependent hydrolase (beta-lactamase superfamily II)|nr:MBL fold metallo-hydrolase [Rickettsiales bacterium]